jgi:hypothetical protein
MAATNAFLKEFIEFRKALQPSPTIVGNPKPANPATKKRKEKFTKEQEKKDCSLMTICQEKPHKRVVIDYLQDRCNYFTEAKMA